MFALLRIFENHPEFILCDLGSKDCDKVSDLEYFFCLNEVLFKKLQSYLLEEKRYQVHIVAIVAILNRCIFFIYYLESHVQSLSIKNQGFHDKIKKIWRWKFDYFVSFLKREEKSDQMKCMQQIVMCILAHGLRTELFLIYDARTKIDDDTTGKNTSDNTVEFWNLPFDRQRFHTPSAIAMFLSAFMHVPFTDSNTIVQKYSSILGSLLSYASKCITKSGSQRVDGESQCDNMVPILTAAICVLLAGKEASSSLDDFVSHSSDVMFVGGGYGIDDIVVDYGSKVKHEIDMVVVDIIQKWWNFAPSSNIDGLLRPSPTIGGHSISYDIRTNYHYD